MIFAPTTLVISRRADTDRRARFRAQADAIQLEDWSFFDAIDGLAMRLSTSTPSLWGRAGRPAPEPLSAGEIGCALSHVAIWRATAALGRRVCVIEDDVEVPAPESFEDEWDRFMRELPSDWLMVHAAGSDLPEPAEPVSEHVSRVRHSYGTRFMLLTGEALDMLTAMDVVMAEPADWLLPPLFATGRVYCPAKPLLQHRNDPGISISPYDLTTDRPRTLEDA